jgi:hypothetical protein
MNVKIQGGGNGTYANTGSCVMVTNYITKSYIKSGSENASRKILALSQTLLQFIAVIAK